MDGGPQRLVAVSPQIDFMDLTGLVANRSGPGQSLSSVWIIKAGAIGADFAQQAWGDRWTGSGQRTKEMVIGMLRKELLDVGAVGLDLALVHAPATGCG